MGARGPLPKSNVVRLRDGNPGKRKTPPQPKPRPIAPTVPAHLPAVAKTQWRKVVPELELTGLATAVDGPVLEVAFMAYAIARRATDALVGRKGMLIAPGSQGQPVTAPELAAFTQSASTFLAAAKAMGMTAESRQRMVAPEVPTDEDDGFDT